MRVRTQSCCLQYRASITLSYIYNIHISHIHFRLFIHTPLTTLIFSETRALAVLLSTVVRNLSAERKSRGDPPTVISSRERSFAWPRAQIRALQLKCFTRANEMWTNFSVCASAIRSSSLNTRSIQWHLSSLPNPSPVSIRVFNASLKHFLYLKQYVYSTPSLALPYSPLTFLLRFPLWSNSECCM